MAKHEMRVIRRSFVGLSVVSHSWFVIFRHSCFVIRPCGPYAAPPENHLFLPRSLSELPITEIELRLIAALAHIGVRTPSAASGIASTL
jgi:hypothetical protein